MFEFKKTRFDSAISHALGRLSAFTKRLSVMPVDGGKTNRKKVVISSRDMYISSLHEGTKMVVETHADKSALFVRPATLSDTKTRVVSYRTYKKRQGTEPVVDIRHQEQLADTIGDASHVHVSFEKEGIWIKPCTAYAKVAAQQTLGATFTISMPDKQGVYSQILKALKIIKQSYFSTIMFITSEQFAESKEYLILCIQLRRLGFTIKGDNNSIICYLEQVPLADVSNDIDLESYNYNDSTRSIFKRFNFKSPLSTFMACTAGVDIRAMEDEGFETQGILEYRVPEKRDFKTTRCKETGETKITHTDKTDTGALSAAINSRHAKVVFNEDIYQFDMALAGRLMPEFNTLHISIQCDDFSNMKSESLKQQSIENLDSTMDMFIPALEFIDATNAPVVVLENVSNFTKSIECKLLMTGLRWLGHDVSIDNYSATEFGGMTKRVRAYMVSSQLGASFPQVTPQKRSLHAWNDVIAPRLHELRDVSHCKAIQKGINTKRIRLINEGDSTVPTIVKSQNRQVADSVYVYLDGKYYMPSNDMIKALMGIPEDFDTSSFSAEITCEIIGQSIEFPLHSAIANQVKGHIERFVNSTRKLANMFTNNKKTALFA